MALKGTASPSVCSGGEELELLTAEVSMVMVGLDVHDVSNCCRRGRPGGVELTLSVASNWVLDWASATHLADQPWRFADCNRPEHAARLQILAPCLMALRPVLVAKATRSWASRWAVYGAEQRKNRARAGGT